MIFFNNNYRKYLGLKPTKDTYICKEYKKTRDNTTYYVFFDSNKMVKILQFRMNEYATYISEMDVNYETSDSNTVLLPKTMKGHPKKITCSLLDTLTGIGTYFAIYKSGWDNKYHFNIGNYTTQKYYYEGIIEKEITDEESIKRVLDDYISDTTKKDLKEIQEFSKEEKKNIKYKEGDYFRVKYGRHKYCYGRILMDITKRIKKGMDFWYAFMGKTIIVEMFHIFTEDDNVPISKLEAMPTFPSMHILDNRLFYGDYVIIGNRKLSENIKYPIMFGRSIDAMNPNQIIFQCGEIHKEIPLNKIDLENFNISLHQFRMNGTRFNIDLDEEIIKECLKSKSNDPYWNQFRHGKYDLRSPENKKNLLSVLKIFDLEDLYNIYN